MTLERTYTIPLRKGFIEKSRHKKTKGAVSELIKFLSRHMKSDNIKIGANLNKELWKHGIKNPPCRVKVTVIKEDDGTVKAELLGVAYAHLTKEEAEKKQKKDPKKSEAKGVESKVDKAEEKSDAADDSNAESKPKTTKKKVAASKTELIFLFSFLFSSFY